MVIGRLITWSNFLETEHIVFSRRVILARAWTKHAVLSKVRNIFWSRQDSQQLILLAADATRKVVETTVGEHVLLFQAGGQLRTFGSTHDLEIFRPADPECILFSRNSRTHTHTHTHRFRRPGPARNMGVSGFGRDVFFGGRSSERSVLDRFCSESTKTVITFDQRSRIESWRHPQQ